MKTIYIKVMEERNMGKTRKLYGTTFYGNEVSEYAKENGYLDYSTLSKAFDAVLNNDIVRNTWGLCGEWEQIHGFIDNSAQIQELKDELEEIKEACEYESNEEEFTMCIIYERRIKELESLIEELEESDTEPEIYQSFIVSEQGAEIIQRFTDNPVFYNDALNMYVWGITHWGTSWDYVLTDVKLNCGQEAWE